MLYLFIKAFHVISVIAWMAAMLYLPRLYVYHSTVEKDSAQDLIFRLMERRLLKVIMTPAMLASFFFGLWLVLLDPSLLAQGWFHVKLAVVLLLTGVHGKFAVMYKAFLVGTPPYSEGYYRIWNEVPTILMIVIVILAIVKPF